MPHDFFRVLPRLAPLAHELPHLEKRGVVARRKDTLWEFANQTTVAYNFCPDISSALLKRWQQPKHGRLMAAVEYPLLLRLEGLDAYLEKIPDTPVHFYHRPLGHRTYTHIRTSMFDEEFQAQAHGIYVPASLDYSYHF